MTKGGKLGPSIIAWLRGQPAGGKPNLGDMRRAVAADVGHAVTPGQLATAIQSLRLSGKLHWERIELSPSMMLAPADPPLSYERPQGAILVDRLRHHARAQGLQMKVLLQPITSNPDTWLRQLEVARNPRPQTIERVEALLRGEVLPPKQARAIAPEAMPISHAEREARGLPPSGRMARDARSLAHTVGQRNQEDLRRREAFRAREVRRPGESLADAAKRAAEGAALRHELASVSGPNKGNKLVERLRAIGAQVDAEEAEEEAARRDGELETLATPSSLLRRAQRDWPDQCTAVRGLAAELGIGLAEAWHRVIKAGLDCLSDDDAVAA